MDRIESVLSYYQKYDEDGRLHYVGTDMAENYMYGLRRHFASHAGYPEKEIKRAIRLFFSCNARRGVL